MSSSDSTCRFLYENLVEDGTTVRVSSARPGLVGLPAPQAAGSAVAYSAGRHTGDMDQVFVVEIDDLGLDGAVGQATFRWRRADAPAWEATELITSSSLVELADGVCIKWVGGAGHDFHLGDRWTILATRPQGPAALADTDRDTAWEATGCADERIALDLGQPRAATALVLGDHNLTDEAQVTLDVGLCLDLDFTAGSHTDRVSMRELVCLRGDPVWGLVDGALTEIPANTPALVDDPAGGQGKALMASPASTNLVEQSRDLADEWWHRTRCHFAGPVEGPGGMMDGLGLVGTAELDTHYLYSEPIAVGSSSVLTLSCFARPGNRDWLELRLAYYDDQAVFTGGDSLFVQVADGPYTGWSRYQATMTVPAGTATLRVILRPAADDGSPSYTGDDSTVDMYLTGAQLEEAYSATPYIPTSGASASRGEETIYLGLTEAMKYSLWDGSGTALAEVIPGYAVSGEVYANILSTTATDYGTPYHSFSLMFCHGAYLYSRDFRDHKWSVAQSWEADTAYTCAVRWSIMGAAQPGVGPSWGISPSGYQGFKLDDPARLYLLSDLTQGPMYLRSVKVWEHRDAAATPAQVGEDCQETLAVTSPHLVHFMEREARSWLITIQDPDNPAGALTAALLYLGGHFQPSRGLSLSTIRHTLAASRTVNATDAGLVTGSARGLARQISFGLRGLGLADVEALEAMQAAVHQAATGRLRPIFFLPLGASRPDWALYCLPPASLIHRQESAARHALEMTLTEVAASHA